MIQGLQITIAGEELRRLLEERLQEHRRLADHWKSEAERTTDDQTEEHPLLPDDVCEHEEARHTWRADALEFIREHVDPSAVYLLGQSDLEFGELLPPKPGSLEQEEYQERTGVAFNLERLTKRVGELSTGLMMAREFRGSDHDSKA